MTKGFTKEHLFLLFSVKENMSPAVVWLSFILNVLCSKISPNNSDEPPVSIINKL